MVADIASGFELFYIIIIVAEALMLCNDEREH